jgi:hypothetical protein
MKGALAAVALLAAAGAGAQPPAGAPCRTGDKPCLLKTLKAHPAGTAAYWKDALARPVADRIGPAPRELVDYLQLDNALNGFAEKPRPSRLAEDFVADVRGAIADLPPAVRRTFDGTFAGVWFVDGLGGTGYTDLIRDADGRPAGGFIVLDAALLGRFTANAWATWKENTPFRPKGGWQLDARIEEPRDDNRRSAIRYILLHELGHVLSINRDVHPRWDRPPNDTPESARLPFFALSWTIDRGKNRYASRFDAEFPGRGDVVYYLGAKLDADRMAATYASLERTNFPTLYAATSPGDDFAESFASYVHTALMKRPWEITISRNGAVDRTYRACWEEPRCAAKRRILEELLR